MSKLVQTQSWELFPKFELVPKHLYIFSIIQNPWQRFCKGMAENAWVTNERSFEIVRKNRFYQMSFLNPHLLPISAQIPEALPYMNYVVMDHPAHPVNDLLNELFEQHGSVTRIKDSDTKHLSSQRKRAYQAEVRQWLESPRYLYRKQIMHINLTDHENWHAATRALDPEIKVVPWYQNFRNWIFTSE